MEAADKDKAKLKEDLEEINKVIKANQESAQGEFIICMQPFVL